MRFREDIVEAFQLVSQKGIQDRFVEQDGACFVPQIREDVVETIQLVSQRRFKIASWSRMVRSPVPQIREDIVGAIQLVSQKGIQDRFVEQDGAFPPCRRSGRTSWRRFSLCLRGDSRSLRGAGWCVPPVPQIREDIVEAIQLVSQRRFKIASWSRMVRSACVSEEIQDRFVEQDGAFPRAADQG